MYDIEKIKNTHEYKERIEKIKNFYSDPNHMKKINFRNFELFGSPLAGVSDEEYYKKLIDEFGEP